jgi:hypothetical protein
MTVTVPVPAVAAVIPAEEAVQSRFDGARVRVGAIGSGAREICPAHCFITGRLRTCGRRVRAVGVDHCSVCRSLRMFHGFDGRTSADRQSSHGRADRRNFRHMKHGTISTTASQGRFAPMRVRD